MGGRRGPSRKGWLRAAGALCLVAGLFPQYSRTPRGDGLPGSAMIDLRIGLPFSPVFLYHYERQEPSSATMFEGRRVEYSSASSWFSTWGIFVSLSAALVVAGVVLLIVSLRPSRGHSLTRPPPPAPPA